MTLAGVIHEDGEPAETHHHHEIDHKHATSHQSFKFHHFHAVPVYVKKEDQQFLKHPVEVGGIKHKLKVCPISCYWWPYWPHNNLLCFRSSTPKPNTQKAMDWHSKITEKNITPIITTTTMTLDTQAPNRSSRATLTNTSPNITISPLMRNKVREMCNKYPIYTSYFLFIFYHH